MKVTAMARPGIVYSSDPIMAPLSQMNRVYVLCMIVVAALLLIFRSRVLALMTKSDKQSEYELIRKYLLNDSPLYGYKRPKLWIHSSYEYNERVWKSFRDRGSYDLNQPYLHLTIRTIINHCGNDFNVCLIDDETFGKIIPSWTVDMKSQSDSVKRKLREFGLAQLVYYYGGMVVPNSFICTRNLMGLYRSGVGAKSDNASEMYPSSGTRMFAVEKPNVQSNRLGSFAPSTYFFGAPKNHPMVEQLCKLLSPELSVAFYSGDSEFTGRTSKWLHKHRAKSNDVHNEKKDKDSIDNRVVYVLSGKHVGVKNSKNKVVRVDDLLQEAFIHFDEDKLFGVFLPSDEILARRQFEYFASLSSEHIMLRSNLIASRYLQMSMVESSDLHALRASKNKNKEESVVVI